MGFQKTTHVSCRKSCLHGLLVALKQLYVRPSCISCYRKLRHRGTGEHIYRPSVMFHILSLSWCPAAAASVRAELGSSGALRGHVSYQRPQEYINDKIDMLSLIKTLFHSYFGFIFPVTKRLETAFLEMSWFRPHEVKELQKKQEKLTSQKP